jgi:hypothetical protein
MMRRVLCVRGVGGCRGWGWHMADHVGVQGGFHMVLGMYSCLNVC